MVSQGQAQGTHGPRQCGTVLCSRPPGDVEGGPLVHVTSRGPAVRQDEEEGEGR